MLKNNKNLGVISEETVGFVNYGRGFAVYDSVPDSLVGRIMPIIEGMGLKESQEKAIKGIIKGTIYRVFFDENFPITLSDELHSLLRKKYYEKNSDQKSVPPSGLDVCDIE